MGSSAPHVFGARFRDAAVIWEAALPFVGNVLGAWAGYEGTKDTNEANLQGVREKMAFDERMSNTSWQRGVKDMEAAGINPMLAFSRGGASTPQAAVASLQNPMGNAVSSASQMATLFQSAAALSKSEAEVDLLKAQTEQVRNTTVRPEVFSAQSQSQLEELLERVKGMHWDARQREINYNRDHETFSADVARRKAEARSARLRSEADEELPGRAEAERRLLELEIPKSKSSADFYSSLGSLEPWLRAILMGIGGLADIKRISR